MRFIRTIAVLVPVVLAGALPSLAAEPATPGTTETSPAASAPAQPAEIPGLMPEPTPAYGMKAGPCTVAVACLNGYPIGCTGQTVCYWKVDSMTSRGFVECDGVRTTCSVLPLE